MAEFLYLKRKCSDESNVLQMRQKLQLIMQTLQTQKQSFEREHNDKIRQYKEEIKYKDFQIDVLKKELDMANQQLRQTNKQSQDYKQLIFQLKREFFKMAEVVNRTNFIESQSETATMLTRAKSDFNSTKFSNICLSKKSVSSQQSMKFDINGYFEKVKRTSKIESNIKLENDDQQTRTNTIEDNHSRLGSTWKTNNRCDYFRDMTNKSKSSGKKLSKWASTMALPTQAQNLGHIRCRKSKQNNWMGTF